MQAMDARATRLGSRAASERGQKSVRGREVAREAGEGLAVGGGRRRRDARVVISGVFY